MASGPTISDFDAASHKNKTAPQQGQVVAGSSVPVKCRSFMDQRQTFSFKALQRKEAKTGFQFLPLGGDDQLLGISYMLGGGFGKIQPG